MTVKDRLDKFEKNLNEIRERQAIMAGHFQELFEQLDEAVSGCLKIQKLLALEVGKLKPLLEIPEDPFADPIVEEDDDVQAVPNFCI